MALSERLVLGGRRPVRTAVAFSTLLLAGAATGLFVFILAGGEGLNGFEIASIPLFATLMVWICFSTSMATCGFVASLRSMMRQSSSEPTRSFNLEEFRGQRTAVLMPIYNESPTRVAAGIKAMIADLKRTRISNQFDFYILSDSNKSESWIEEQVVWSNLIDEVGEQPPIFYRHRPRNEARKAGNIEDFVTRWGYQYPFMILLDADSLLTANTLCLMVEKMRADSELGLLQVPPQPIGCHSLFARLQQFSASVYGPVFVTGFSTWAGDEGNYWGHNAIIRVDAFRENCKLPLLAGKPPLGGEILSHDFVEAALLVRAGWKVQVATGMGGSYEECPTTVADYAIRDQRWCQGNLQHSKLLFNEGFRLLSRLHLGCGVMAYLASPIWVALMVLSVLSVLVSVEESEHGSAASVLHAFWLFLATMSILLLPKVFGLIVTSLRAEKRFQHGGLTNLWISAFFETFVSVLIAPLMAVYHTRFVWAILRRKSVKWNAQRRGEYGVGWREAIIDGAAITVGGAMLAGILYLTAPFLLIWFSPIVFGCLLTVPLLIALGSQRFGTLLRNAGLLLIPAETDPEPVIQEHQYLLATECETEAATKLVWFERLLREPQLYLMHANIQATTNGHVSLPVHQAKAIEVILASGGAGHIPEELRYGLLLDRDSLKSIHITVQLGSTDSRETSVTTQPASEEVKEVIPK